MLSDSTRAVIERLIEAAIDSAFKWSATEKDADKFESAIAEARKLLADDGWIRVEDALPESGVPVIAFVPRYGGHTNSRRIRAQYAAKHSLEQHMEADGGDYDEASDTYYCEPGWYEDNEYEEIHWCVSDEVTHWQPLPQPPKDAK